MKRINLLKILKAKIPYFLTGLLVLAVVCAAVFSPEVYFRIEDWAAEANPQTEYVTLQGRTSSDFSTTEKLEILGYLDLMNLSSYSMTRFLRPKDNSGSPGLLSLPATKSLGVTFPPLCKKN